MNPLYTFGWVILFVLGGVLETLAIIDRRRGDTLSEHVWKVFLVKDARHPVLRWLLRIPLLGALTWLTLHFAFGL